MSANNGVLVVSIGPTDDIRNTAEYNLWKFIATVLAVDMAKFEILLFPGEIGRRVLLRNGIMSKQECINKIKEYLQPYVKGEVPSTSQALLFPHTPLAVYAHNDTAKSDNGQWKYYEKNLKKDEELSEKSLSKRLLEMKPYYEKDPSLMAKVFRDLGVQKEVTFRGRLVPGSPVKPVLDDYRGQKKLKVVRRILEGTDRSVKYPKSKMRIEMSHPVPDLIMLDYLSPDKQNVVSRRVVNILYRNATVDLVEELEYTEVV
ncbi:uncharacterized protein LOC128997385 [Macrosteles quadrilineatus]|uniref:uncharacterized protein LOC128997385 n=1 Tax=Macrosteles quadrilineatus TaxID=74068 RepID=UPI0023E2DA9A|nr:uncharacterized protein LOC128997385 [Macrosteles quadrilineatus]